MMGTTISIISVCSLACSGIGLTSTAVEGMMTALVPALLMNVAIVGLNQVFDVEIDKVNKPYLPLASGQMSLTAGIAIVTVTAILSLALGIHSGSAPLFWTLLLSLVLGVLYSTDLPFMRWKRFPVLAAGCVLAVRAIFVQFGFYYHMKLALGTAQFTLTRPLTFAITFMLFFSIVIALFKDLPDIKGDEQAGISTFGVRFGVKSVFDICVSLLVGAYAVAVVFGLSASVWWSTLVIPAGHTALAAFLLHKAKAVNVNRRSDLTDFYMFIWKLFYLEYALIPFLR